MGSRGEATVGGVGQSPGKAKEVCRHYLQVLTEKNDQHLKILHSSSPDS